MGVLPRHRPSLKAQNVRGHLRQNTMKIITFLFILTIIFGCNQTEIKKIITKYKNGTPKMVYYFPVKNDTLTYRKEYYYESGKINYTGQILDGSKSGVWIWWYENGNRKDKCKYKNGFYVDTVYHWYKNGKIKQLEILSGRKVRTEGCSVCDGNIIRFFENGKLKEKFKTLNNKIQGTYLTYEKNGNWKIRTYRNDTLNGPSTEYIKENGKIIKVYGQYKNGNEDGLWKWFNNKNKLYQTATFEEGFYNGQYLKFHPNGKIKEKANLINGEYNGEVFYYNSKGNLIKIENYLKGKIQNSFIK